MKKLLSLLFLTTLCLNAYAFGTNGCNSNTVFLSHGDGANGALAAVEEACSTPTAKTITFVNTTQLSTAQKKFGVSSFNFLVTTDVLTLANSTDFSGIGTGNVTVDGWVRLDSIAARLSIFEIGAAPLAAGGLEFDFEDFGGGQLSLYIAGGTAVTFAWAPSINVWYHYAVVRSGTTWTVYIDGTSLGTTTSAGDINGTGGVRYGRSSFLGGNWQLIGYQDEMRIVKGQAMWTANFTVPQTPYCRGCEMFQLLEA